jgi:DoxX-like family
MNTALWIAQSLLAAIMIAAGTPKLFLPRPRLVAKFPWTQDAPQPLVRLLGLAELAGAAGLIVPRALGIAPFLTPIAAGCLCLILVGALTTKLRLHESPALPAVAMLLAVFVVIGRVLG